MNNTLRDRLRRLGVKQGREGLKPTQPKGSKAAQPWNIESLVPGREVSTDLGAHFVAEATYPLSHQHGTRTLGDVLNCAPHTAAQLSRADSLAHSQLSGLAFFDIETTGLAGGAGTLAFLIGVGVIEDDQFVLRQFFLRDPSEEASLLQGVTASLQDKVGLVTYNGRTFDVPIVQTRFTLTRHRFDLTAYPNLDLLPAARRLWRGRYDNCSLGTLETQVLGLNRTAADVPGFLIPQLYVDYLRSGDARDMQRVIYHNAEDILSMVSLAAHILETFADPLSDKRSGLDCLRLAMWQDDRNQTVEAEDAYRTALSRKLPTNQKPILFERYAALLKRLDRRAEAVPLWEKWADLAEDNPEPCLELAKYYEWDVKAKDIEQAKSWAARALLCVTHQPKGWRRDEAWKDIQHRLERLGKKRDNIK
jgi:hypothetical protein